jgi:hypothetical protein
LKVAGGGQQAEGIMTLNQRTRSEGGPLRSFTREAYVTLVNPDKDSSIAAIEIRYDYNEYLRVNEQEDVYSNDVDENLLRVHVQPRDAASLGKPNEETGQYERGEFDNRVIQAAPSIAELPIPRHSYPHIGMYLPHQPFVEEKTSESTDFGLRIAKTKYLEGIKELCNSDLLSSNPEIRSLIKGFIDSVLDGTLCKQQTLAAQDSMALLKQQSINS